MSQKKRKGRVLEMKSKEPNFIKFSNVQRNYLSEVRVRQIKEWNDTLESVYEDLGIMHKIREAPPGTYRLRHEDLSGLDVLPVKKEVEKEESIEEKKTEEKEAETEEKSKPDN